MKMLILEKGEPAYIKVPIDCNITIDPTTIRQKGYKLFLVRSA